MRLFQALKIDLSKGLLTVVDIFYKQLSYSLMLSPCLSLGLDLQCFTWFGKMIQRFIYTHFQRSAVLLRFRGCLSFSWKFFHVQPHPTSICFISHLFKNFRILVSMNLIHLITVSYHQVCQGRQFQTQVSLLFLTFYGRATIDSDAPRGS